MYEYLEALPWQGWAALLALAGTALWKPAELLLKWARESGAAAQGGAAKAAELDAERDGRLIEQLLGQAHEHEEIQSALRKALDKSLVRENGLVTAAELLLGIIEQIPRPTEPMKLMRLRAIEILEMARRINASNGRGGQR